MFDVGESLNRITRPDIVPPGVNSNKRKFGERLTIRRGFARYAEPPSPPNKDGERGDIVQTPISNGPHMSGERFSPKYPRPGIFIPLNRGLEKIRMERQIRLWLWGCNLLGLLFATGIGIAPDDPGMIQGALLAAVGGFLVTPFVARMWKA